MSKYLYTTVYEEFTGSKPPEPQDSKPKRKRGYGHPYRMRLNMQESEATQSQNHEQSYEHNQSNNHSNNNAPSRKPERRNQFGQPIGGTQRKERSDQGERSERRSFSQRQPREEHSMQLQMPRSPEKNNTGPKVTYKKRRVVTPMDNTDSDTQP